MTASLEAVTTGDPGRWRALLPARRSAFGSLEFARITEQHTGASARLLVFTEGETVVTYPSFLRPISDLRIAAGTRVNAWDSVSPEYTGPLARPAATGETAHRFRDRLAAYCRQERIVAEFAHLHPWHRSGDLVPAENEFLDREIVYVDLRLAPEQLWHDSFTYACRKNIMRARSEHVRVAQAATPADVQDVHRIYSQTMARRGAMARYSFPLSYFMALFEQMPDNATCFLARYQDRVVAATLYLHDDLDVYSYLGGADNVFQHVRPTNAIVYEAIRWAQRHGKHRLILGGGYRPEDGIFRFKTSFSPLRARFYVCKRIHLPDEYATLCRRWSAYYGRDVDTSGYFPAYRAVPVAAAHGEPPESGVAPGARHGDG